MEKKLTLVGAGPGDADLITLKGVKALRTANVVLYDALANIELLDYAPADALKIFVGKRKGFKAYSQHEINELIVHYATHFGHVVRLKGGDPFLFGRGYEEIEYAQKFNISVSVVPGISSAIAVPELQHIPVTLRGISESCWITTATISDGSLSNDIHLAAHSSATIVILMGLHKLEEIIKLYIKLGKQNMPVAVIQNGSLQNEKMVVGIIQNIIAKKENAGIASPAIIIIGEVVRMHPLFYASENVFASVTNS